MMADIVERIKTERKEEFKKGSEAAVEWAKNQGYLTIEGVSELINVEKLDADIIPDEYIHGSKEFQKGFKSALDRILKESK